MLKFENKLWTERSNLLPHIVSDEVTGVVYQNVVPAQTVQLFIKTLNALKNDFFTDLNSSNGFSLPGMFGQLHKTQPEHLVEKYFNDIPLFCEATNRLCSFDLLDWVNAQLNLALKPYVSIQLPGFLPYSFRVVFPGKGGLFMHRDGNLLPFIHDSVSTKIEKKIRPETMMSWYFTLQAPAEGGELWVADRIYDSYQKQGERHIVSPDGNLIQEEDMVHITVPTPVGSLLMFKGGSYWHKVVSPSSNSQDRITLGGFMAMAVDGERIYFWS